MIFTPIDVARGRATRLSRQRMGCSRRPTETDAAASGTIRKARRSAENGGPTPIAATGFRGLAKLESGVARVRNQRRRFRKDRERVAAGVRFKPDAKAPFAVARTGRRRRRIARTSRACQPPAADRHRPQARIDLRVRKATTSPWAERRLGYLGGYGSAPRDGVSGGVVVCVVLGLCLWGGWLRG